MAIDTTPHVLTHAVHSYVSPIFSRSPRVRRLIFLRGSASSSALGSVVARSRGPTYGSPSSMERAWRGSCGGNGGTAGGAGERTGRIDSRGEKRCGAFHVASKPWIRGGRGPRRAEGSRRGRRAPDAPRMGANGRWVRMERRGDREKGGRRITHRHGGRLIDPLGRGAPRGRGRADLLRLGRACLAKDQRARVATESSRGTGTRADVGHSSVPGARAGRSDAMRGRHVAHSRHHLVSVVVG